MQSDKKMYHALFPRIGFVGERGHDRRLHREQTPVFCALAKCGASEFPIFKRIEQASDDFFGPKSSYSQNTNTAKPFSRMITFCFEHKLCSLMIQGAVAIPRWRLEEAKHMFF